MTTLQSQSNTAAVMNQALKQNLEYSSTNEPTEVQKHLQHVKLLEIKLIKNARTYLQLHQEHSNQLNTLGAKAKNVLCHVKGFLRKHLIDKARVSHHQLLNQLSEHNCIFEDTQKYVYAHKRVSQKR